MKLKPEKHRLRFGEIAAGSFEKSFSIHSQTADLVWSLVPCAIFARDLSPNWNSIPDYHLLESFIFSLPTRRLPVSLLGTQEGSWKNPSFLGMQKYLYTLTTALRHHKDFVIKDIPGLPLCSKTLQTADLSNYQNNLRAATWFVPCAAEKSARAELAWFSVGLPRPGESWARWDCKQGWTKGGVQVPQHMWERDSHKGEPHTAPVTWRVNVAPDTQIQTQEPNFTQELKMLILQFVCKVALCKVNKAITACCSRDPFEFASLSMQ